MSDINTASLSDAKRLLLQQRIRGAGGARPARRPLVHRVCSGPAPLSVVQEQLWYFSHLAPDNPVYNEAVSIHRDGDLDEDAFWAAFTELVRRHEIWRSTFTMVDGQPVQVVHTPVDQRSPLVDLSALSRNEAEARVAALAADQARRPYHLDEGPLVRPLLVRMAPHHHRLHLALHHLVFDGVSLYRVILPELVALYESFAAGEPSALPEPPLQYADYAVWSREQAEGDDFARRLGHWRARLGDAPALDLPLDMPRPPRQSFRGGMERVTIPVALADGLRSLSSASGGTLFQTVAAAFAALLHRYSGQPDVVFGTLADLRSRPELEAVVGYCLTPLVLRAALGDDPPFDELVRRVRGDLLDGLRNVVPFERLVRDLQPQRDQGANPLFQAAIVLEPATTATSTAWSLHQMDPDVGNAVGHAKFDLHLELDERPDGHIAGRLIYSSDVFTAATARRFAGHWTTLLEGIVAAPRSRISELPLLSTAEQHRLQDWNATAAPYPHTARVHELIAAQAERTPDAVAVVSGDEQLTYAELQRRARQLGARLREHNPDGAVVAICTERSADMVVAMLAAWHAGAPYLPLDTQYPRDRLAFMLHDSGARVLLTERRLLAGLPGHHATVVCLDDDAQDDRAIDGDVTTAQSGSSADPAYLLYTSGSTGRPKGVLVPHRAVVNLLTSMAREPGLGPDDTVVAVTTYAFDIAVVEIWLPLLCGARTVIATREVVSDGRRLARLLRDVGATMMQATPSGWQLLLDSGWRGADRLTALCGGEALSQPLADALVDRTAAAWNMYGPTETTVWSTCSRLESGRAVTIGGPIANTTLYVLDAHLRPVPVGVHGELWIGGDGVTEGYLNRPDETAARFVADPFVPGARMYRTGDLVRRRADGDIEYLGRLDHQVKVRGFRVELGEIEAALLGHVDVAAAVAVAREATAGDRRLVAYITPVGEPPDVGELSVLLRRTLPEHMIPAAIVVLDALPLTPNGKVDRNALPAPEWAAGAGAARVAPRTTIEMRLATIWARALAVDEVGVEDNFFDLGGHSLLAVRLLATVEEELGVEVSLAAFFAGGATVASMAAEVTALDRPGCGTALAVPIQTRGSSPYLFFVQPDESNLLALRHFVGPLGADQRLMGLLPERVGRRFDRSRSIEDLAAPMLASIRTAQPHGPYFLAGFSLGALLAYELAGRLRAAGEEVPVLAILDCPTPAAVRRWMWLTSPRGFFSRVRERGVRRAVRKVSQGARRLVSAPVTNIRARDSRGPAAAHLLDDFDWDGATHLGIGYACPPNDVAMELFVSDDAVDVSRSRSLGWEDVHAGPITIHEVPGVHLSLLTEPHVRQVAAEVATSLRRARGDVGALRRAG